MARVEYLRRHGFEAKLVTTDKFPKGDVIVARRLPKDFMAKMEEVRNLEKTDPWKGEKLMRQLDILAAGGQVAELSGEFGEKWMAEDFAELTRRFVAPKFEQFKPVNASEKKEAAPDAGQDKKEAKAARLKLLGLVFADVGGRMDSYVEARLKAAGQKQDKKAMSQLIKAIQNRAFREGPEESPEKIRQDIDALMKELGY
jgi:hypothetical protein